MQLSVQLLIPLYTGPFLMLGLKYYICTVQMTSRWDVHWTTQDASPTSQMTRQYTQTQLHQQADQNYSPASQQRYVLAMSLCHHCNQWLLIRKCWADSVVWAMDATMHGCLHSLWFNSIKKKKINKSFDFKYTKKQDSRLYSVNQALWSES